MYIRLKKKEILIKMTIKIDPIVPGRSGNTKQISPCKHWFFTLNNPSEKEFKNFRDSDSSIVPRYVFQLEMGELGTIHLQGYLCFANKKRAWSYFPNKRVHWEKVKNIPESIRYCQKEETRLQGPWFRGIDPVYKHVIEKWTPWMLELKEILNEPPSFRTIHWCYDLMGNIGKTHFQKWVFSNMDSVVILSGRSSDMKNCIVSYKEKNHRIPKIVLINIPRSKEGFVSWSGIEEIKDMFFYSGKYEGGMICGNNPHVMIFANYYPDLNMLSNDRWVIKRL